VSLLSRYPGVDGLVAEIAERVDDEHPPVRKAALATLGAMAATVAVRTARGKTKDPVPYVRSMALRVLGLRGADERDSDRRRFIAAWITPSLGDGDWDVRLAAKEALSRLGIGTWREIAAQLDSPDEFARNGAAEVLQNLGLLDWTLRGLGSGVQPSAELVDVVQRALREGGLAMVHAANKRLEPEPIPGIETLVPGLRPVGAVS
jgi:HEAT repeat protein